MRKLILCAAGALLAVATLEGLWALLANPATHLPTGIVIFAGFVALITPRKTGNE